MPAYARPDSDTMVAGVIASLNGRSALSLRDDRGFTDRIALHRGTVILPSGAKLGAGMKVTIYGHQDGDVFDADEIDGPADAAEELPGVVPLTQYLQTGSLNDGYGYGLPYGSGSAGLTYPVWGAPSPYVSAAYPAYPYSSSVPVIIVVPQPAAAATPFAAPGPHLRRALSASPSYVLPPRAAAQPRAIRAPMIAPRAAAPVSARAAR